MMKTILTILFLSITIYSQTLTIGNLSSGSDTTFTENKIQLFSPNYEESPMVPISYHSTIYTKMVKSNYTSFQEYRYAMKDNREDIYSGKQQLGWALNNQVKFNTQKSLGTFGKVLAIANAAAAGYLLYKHVEKYHDKYGIK